MKKAEAFVNPVNQYGLPHWYIPWISLPESTDIYFKTPQALCRFYWALDYLRVHYTYEINGTTIERDFNVSANLAPKERLWRAPLVYSSIVDEEIAYVGNLGMAHIKRNDEAGLFLVKWELFESDADKNFILSNQVLPGMKLLSQKQFNLMGQTANIYLYSNRKGWQGKIHAASLDAIYYQW
ncbi:MAG: hypothetical protein COZ46_07635 [Verrucomicrobia bacterium CG_4_10_14_3_um_filter_43_23]|nr:MAG: hypothetical protein AUJ82_03280 [Verrucomicrobia bacterium CG1_02_43_26]PIP59718.1 MAG: hypothetical protein COX01_02110 [Verrucomicrobia bacterium CG22_combo_CG10-13_8_21_14_all_43_17]PIX57730.1 MAG: hypothetical protein COZ46_07635 [Verrucomicrobia bacterium CG_4_10_14_3_um_filter_43_23]PIY62522.1 MAG: hypothetical protein COY94_01820 [Verrucomicrobia bacterium CG_4_10_14_0_8_um_filter_43_34]PJA44658.1 MAG: hypothetical protein CO175_01805 [Verrucomicrobia bacterium CG_4_9_14_3_um_fi